MLQEELLYLLALKFMPGIGPITAQNLIAYCKSPSRVFQIPKGKLLRVPEVGKRTIQNLENKEVFKSAEKELKYCEQENIRIIAYTDPEYPLLLKQIPDLPLVLFVKGRLNLNCVPWVAVVGTRRPDEYGRITTRQMVEPLCEAGAGIVSGLAFGIDQEAHRACLQQKGVTAAVLGHGLGMIYPYHHKGLSEKIIESGGALITEYPHTTQPDAPNFPSRNRIVAGMSRAVLVIQAAVSGGALITAKLGFDYDREVFAIPGDLNRKTTEGCNGLIQNQVARLLQNPSEILELLQVQEQIRTPHTHTAYARTEGLLLSVDEKRMLQYLENAPLPLDELAQSSGQSIPRLQAQLLALEIKGLVRILPGRMVSLV